MSFGVSMAKDRPRDDAEKPFWISYADLMTALMILFLVIMVTSLTLISRQVEDIRVNSQAKDRITPEPIPMDIRAREISSICDHLSDKVKQVGGAASVDCRLNRINFGEVGRFKTDQYKLSAKGEQALFDVVPLIIETANTPNGKKWLKQVVIEGFTDTDGSYLYNLNLSLRRSEWVMCTLLRNDKTTVDMLSADQRRQVKKLFLAGGVSFNDQRDTKDASRRVELRLQFYGLDPDTERSSRYESKFDSNVAERCHI